MHPRDWIHPGRIKVELYDELGNAKNDSILTSKSNSLLGLFLSLQIEKVLFDKICEIYPQIKSRVNAPPKEVIEEKRLEYINNAKKERKDRQKEFCRKGIRVTKRRKAKA